LDIAGRNDRVDRARGTGTEDSDPNTDLDRW